MTLIRDVPLEVEVLSLKVGEFDAEATQVFFQAKQALAGVLSTTQGFFSGQRDPVSSQRGPVSQRDHVSSQRWPGLVMAWAHWGPTL